MSLRVELPAQHSEGHQSSAQKTNGQTAVGHRRSGLQDQLVLSVPWVKIRERKNVVLITSITQIVTADRKQSTCVGLNGRYRCSVQRNENEAVPLARREAD